MIEGLSENLVTAACRFDPARRLRPLAAALALAGLAASPIAWANLPLPRTSSVPPIMREDGTPLQVSPRAWHEDALLAYPPSNAPATTREVTNCNDDGPGSLREAVTSSASGDTVDLSALTCSTITLRTGAIAAHVFDLTLIGPGAERLAIDGNDYDRVFLHYGGGGFKLEGLTVRNGARRATGFHLGIAGCIASAGYLTLDHSVVTGCYASGEGAYGGAIYAYSLIMNSSTLSNNVAYGVHPGAGTAAFGGAAFVYQVDLVNSTVTGNRANHRVNPPRTSYDIGAGIMTVRGGFVIGSTIDSNYTFGRGGGLATFADITLTNSTVSGNSAATFGGGGVFLRYPAQLFARNSTITLNHALDGGGIMLSAATSTLQSSIVAANRSDVGTGADIANQSSTSSAVHFGGGNDFVNSVSSAVSIPPDTRSGDPRLMPLANNGGPTRTHALRAGSAAIDAGSNLAQLTSDQRGDGYPRVIGAAADIGAFEYEPGLGAAPAVPAPSLSRAFATVLLALLAFIGLRRVRARA